ncbi:hypothetical protein CYANOKiyG1_28730 [Okeania sp. KiyG1]|nr:hypothetical protein CYANOKiyG1_28730 [Okeania sp. KiyG1]
MGNSKDLETCLKQLENTGKIEFFEIGKRDICDHFIIPEKLYGRQQQVQQLLDAFERVSNPISSQLSVEKEEIPLNPPSIKSEASAGLPIQQKRSNIWPPFPRGTGGGLHRGRERDYQGGRKGDRSWGEVQK